MLSKISGKDNRTIKLLRSLSTSHGRKKHGLYFIEGQRIVSDTARLSGEVLEFIAFSESFAAANLEAAKTYAEGFNCFLLTDALFESVSDTKTPQGILAVAKAVSHTLGEFSAESRILILDGIRDPGNMGTIIRTAEAMGIGSVFLTGGCADVFSPKVLRSAMGSALRTAFYSIDYAEIAELKKMGYRLYSAALSEKSIPLFNARSSEKTALVIGNEASGISDEILEASDFLVKIPMSGKIESLNAASAAAIIMYHFTNN